MSGMPVSANTALIILPHAVRGARSPYPTEKERVKISVYKTECGTSLFTSIILDRIALAPDPVHPIMIFFFGNEMVYMYEVLSHSRNMSKEQRNLCSFFGMFGVFDLFLFQSSGITCVFSYLCVG